MKKKDFKYIIKRIIIGVGIFFCIAFIKKCDVKAATLDICYNSNSIICNNNQTYTSFSFNSPYSNNIYNFNNSVDGTLPYIIFYDQNTTSYFVFFIKDSTSSYYDLYDIKLIYDSIGDSYWVGLKCLDEEDEMCENGYAQTNGYQRVFVLSNSNNLDTSNWGGRNITMYNSPIQNEYIYRSSLTGFDSLTVSKKYMYDNFGNFIVYDTNLSSFSIEDSPIDLNPIPDYYTSIDMHDIPGVYFVPKNYSTISTTQNSNGDTVIPFTYYYKGNFSEGYFPLNDYSKIVFFYDNINSPNDFHKIETWFPYSQNIEGTTYDYYGYILQNNYVNSFQQYLDSIIYYDSRYFDYYIIDDFSDYNSVIDIIDKNGGNAQIDVSITSSLKQLYNQGKNTRQESYIGNSIVHSLDNNVLGQYLDFITIPFNFLNSIPNSTCTPIQLPIPFIGSNIQLPCLSSIFEEYVPLLKNVIFIVVNGLLVYRITMRNIDTLTDVVKADDDKIEVVDL